MSALDFGAPRPIDISVSALVLGSVFLLTLALGAALAKGVLTVMLSLMVGTQVPTVASVRAVAAGLLALVR